SLSVLPTLVYGNPPRARVDDGRLVHLDGPVPLRDEDAERRLVHKLRDELNLVFGRRVDFDGRDAARFLERIRTFRDDVDGSAEEPFSSEPLRGRVALSDDRFDVAFEVETKDEDGTIVRRTADATSVFRAFQDGLGLVALEGGGFAPIPHDW